GRSGCTTWRWMGTTVIGLGTKGCWCTMRPLRVEDWKTFHDPRQHGSGFRSPSLWPVLIGSHLLGTKFSHWLPFQSRGHQAPTQVGRPPSLDSLAGSIRTRQDTFLESNGVGAEQELMATCFLRNDSLMLR